MQNVSVKTEISETPAEKPPNEPENEEEDSSDGEISIITLDSDTAAGTSGEDEEGSESEDLEDEDEEEEEEVEESDSSDDDSDSVWSTINEATDENITSEAAEAKIIKKFEKAVVAIADKKGDVGKKIMQKLLKNPILLAYKKEEFLDFDAVEEPTRLSKMLQVFIAIHKNLAKVNVDSASDHYCQILSYQPNNTAVWFDAALKSVENGNLDFAIYAFKKCETEKESIEAHATVLYLSSNYQACLSILKTYQDDVGELNDKMKYLKWKIRTINNYYKRASDRIFEEDDIYAESKQLDQMKIIVFDERLEELKKRIQAKSEESNASLEEVVKPPIQLTIPAEMNLKTVFILFCDLFDRIQGYSSLSNQSIQFTEWDRRQDWLDCQDALNEIVDVVECIEELTDKVSNQKQRNKRKSKNYYSNWKRRLFVDKPAEEEENSTADDTCDEEDPKSDEDCQVVFVSKFPENELAEAYNLSCNDIKPIRSSSRRESTPPPTHENEFIDETAYLDDLRAKVKINRHYSILEMMEMALLLLAEHTPTHGALTNELRVVVLQMYNRMRHVCQFSLEKFHPVNVILCEMGHATAIEFCVRKYVLCFDNDAEDEDESDSDDGAWAPTLEAIKEKQKKADELLMRFIWYYANTEDLVVDLKLENLYYLKSKLTADDLMKTSIGNFGRCDVLCIIDDLEKKQRKESVKHLWNSSDYKELVKVIEMDIDFTTIDIDETIDVLVYWIQSYDKLKRWRKLAELSVRVLHFFLFTDDIRDTKRVETVVTMIFNKLENVNFKKVESSAKSALGYFLCVAFRKYPKLEENWKHWKVIYEIVKSLRDMPVVEYLETLDKNDDPHALPTLDLDVLVKAHEVLGEAKKCGADNYEFLLFILQQVRELFNDIPTLEALYEKENAWIWSNLNDEIAQILNCLFGKYGKKRKSADDHHSKASCPANMVTAKRVLGVILVQPLPLYDDKERLTHDVIELINSRFDFLLKISDEKKESVKKFHKLLKNSGNSTTDDIEIEFEKCRTVKEPEIQSLVWYAMALSSYRSSSHEDAKKYAELYLSSIDAVHDARLRASAWAILAHEHVQELFQLDYDKIFEQWRWRMMAYRMAIVAQENEAVIHYEIAATMYQLATGISRFLKDLPLDDLRRKRMRDSKALRDEARSHFEKCLSMAQPSSDGTPPEFQWLCYFFIGKLQAKNYEDIVKIVESYYEAACGCQLAGFYYPIKVSTKKQTNFEPLEVHYQAHAAVWKYLNNEENPPLETLQQLLAYLKTFANGHRVVKPSNSLFNCPPELYVLASDMVNQVVAMEQDDDIPTMLVENSITKLEIIEELRALCFKGFTLVAERFPHLKAHYRLAEAALEQGALDTASEHIFKNVFKRKKRDDGMFDNIVEIACNDINRSGSLCYHIERCFIIGIIIASKHNDLHNIVAMLTTVMNCIANDDDQYLEPKHLLPLVRSLLSVFERICMINPRSARNTPSPGPDTVVKKTKSVTATLIRTEVWKIHLACKKEKKEKRLLKMIDKKIDEIINKLYGGVHVLKSKITAAASVEMEKKRKNNIPIKRKAFDFEAMAQPFLKKTASQTAVSSSDSDIQIIESVPGPSRPTPVAPPPRPTPAAQPSQSSAVQQQQMLLTLMAQNPQVLAALAQMQHQQQLRMMQNLPK